MPTPTQTPAAQPTRKIFDPWNSSSTGHQRAENRLSGSTSWRASRSAKLAVQFRSGPGGRRRMYDSVGAGSRDFGKDGRKENGGWEKGAPGVREKGWQDVRGLLNKKNNGTAEEIPNSETTPQTSTQTQIAPHELLGTKTSRDDSAAAAAGKKDEKDKEKDQDLDPPQRGIFSGLCIYINGSTAPMVGDHKLKQLLAENGARISIALGRRSVTHVILGTPNDGGKSGAGGGLAAGKIQKEIQRVGGKGVKFVGVDWILQSLAAGKRLPEPRFSTLALAPKSQKSVYNIFKTPDPANHPP